MAISQYSLGLNLISIAQAETANTVTINNGAIDLSIGTNINATGLGGFSHSLRDRPHSALRMSPCAVFPIGLAEMVMQQDIGCAGVIRRGKIANTAAISHCPFEDICFKPAIEIITNRFGHQLS